jgi:hypothetical protein
VRPAIQADHPRLNNIECTRILAEMWRTVSEDERQVFKRQAADMQSEFKLKNPHYTYKKTQKGERKARVEEMDYSEPMAFRWEELLNHHEESN